VEPVAWLVKDDCWLERTKNVLQIYKLLVAFVLNMSRNSDSDISSPDGGSPDSSGYHTGIENKSRKGREYYLFLKNAAKKNKRALEQKRNQNNAAVRSVIEEGRSARSHANKSNNDGAKAVEKSESSGDEGFYSLPSAPPSPPSPAGASKGGRGRRSARKSRRATRRKNRRSVGRTARKTISSWFKKRWMKTK
jgi:hypothetical protein